MFELKIIVLGQDIFWSER